MVCTEILAAVHGAEGVVVHYSVPLKIRAPLQQAEKGGEGALELL
jgi:hypothetical protein